LFSQLLVSRHNCTTITTLGSTRRKSIQLTATRTRNFLGHTSNRSKIRSASVCNTTQQSCSYITMATSNPSNDKFPVIISNPEVFNQKKQQLIADGLDNIQMVLDFDRTVSRHKLDDGRTSLSTFGILERSPRLSPGYSVATKELFNTYYPIEVDPNYPYDEKFKKMVEWWEKAEGLIVAEKIPFVWLEEMVREAPLDLRRGCDKLFSLTNEHNIPILIFSGGITQLIEMVITQRTGAIYPNMHVVSNHLVPNEQGVISGFDGPMIHVLNKKEQAIAHEKNVAWFKKIEKKKNVILMGDSLHDVDMAEGVKDIKTCLRIGFLNDKVDELLEHYKKVFDVVICNDGPMDWPVTFVEELINAKTAQK
jgi:HAD superfamily hydrolase (TIGR01544 family)